jgi:hypothetical protein
MFLNMIKEQFAGEYTSHLLIPILLLIILGTSIVSAFFPVIVLVTTGGIVCGIGAVLISARWPEFFLILAIWSTSFEALIKEFEAKTGDSAKPKKSQVLNDFRELADYVRQDKTDKQQQALKKDIENAVDFVSKGDGQTKLPKTILRGMLEGYAAEDEAFAKAFQNRAERPTEWQAQLEKGRKWAADQVKGFTPKETKSRSDIEAAKAAVAGTENEAGSDDDDSNLPSPAEMFDMSGSEFKKLLNKERAKAAQR